MRLSNSLMVRRMNSANPIILFMNGMRTASNPKTCSVRCVFLCCHVGMGQMMALDPTEIEALAAKSNYPEYGISGRCNYISERGVRSLGLSGNKAQHADLTVELGFSSDMGVTNSPLSRRNL